MRFSTYINNAKCLEWKLNANQGALFDLLNQASSWAKEIVIEGKVYYWVSRNEINPSKLGSQSEKARI